MTNPEKRRFIDRVKTIEERLIMIVNPMSKKGSELASRVRSVVRREGMNLEETSTDDPEDTGSTLEFWSKRFGGSRVIMVFGGDGAINQVINNVMLSRSNKNVVLVPIPAGTANDFCRALGFDTVDGALNAMVDFQLRPVDLVKMEIGGSENKVKYYSNILGMGVDGDIARLSRKYRRFGIAGYWYAALKKAAISIFKGVETYRVRIDAGDFHYDGSLVGAMFANIASYGRNLLIAPGATLDDGKIYLNIAMPMSGLKAFMSGVLLLKGQHTRMSTVHALTCDSARIELYDGVYTQEDGEVFQYPAGTSINLSLERGALNVLTPGPGLSEET